MKKIIFTLFLMFLPASIALSASFEKLNGYWISNEDFPFEGKRIYYFNGNTLKIHKKKAKKIEINVSNDYIIIRHNDFRALGDNVYKKFYDIIIFKDNDNIIYEVKTLSGSRKQYTFHRITEEEAKQYLR